MIIVIGGVRSGKSSFAEQLAIERRIQRLVYIATSVPYDAEMKERMRRHKETRRESGQPWVTYEQAVNLQSLIPKLREDDIVLLDCLPTWLSNELFMDEKSYQQPLFQKQVYERMTQTLQKINEAVSTLIVVSNDVFSNAEQFIDGTLPYMKALGLLHQWSVQVAEEAYDIQFGQVDQKKEVNE